MADKNYKMVTLVVFFLSIGVSIVASTILEGTFVYEGEAFYAEQPVEYTELAATSTNPQKIKAIVKGSIYETGSNMTVFGACFDGDGYLIPDSKANFTAWYPNGTIMLDETPMTPILEGGVDSGRFRIHVTMVDTIGTYLTQQNCSYLGEYAIAFGEWQNPEWVKRIGDTQLSVANITTIVDLHTEQLINISNDLSTFESNINQNFSAVINTLNTLDAGDEDAMNELRELIHAIDISYWILDEDNPTYSLSSGVFNYEAVDMLGGSNLHVVSSDGRAVYWDGEVWTERNLTGTTLYGVSAVATATPYAWYVGTNDSNNVPIYSINGATPQTISGASGTTFYDVKMFQQPNNPEGDNYVYLITDTGEIWFSDDEGSSFSNVATTGGTGKARISQIVENVVDDQATEGYRVMFGQDDKVVFYNGYNYTTYTLTNQSVKDVGLLYEDKGWIITKDTNDASSKVYYFDGSSLTKQFTTNETTTLTFTGLGVVAQNDLWVVTNDPSVFYHYNGRTWEYSRYPFSDFVGVVIGFGNTSLITGLKDIVMANGKLGYAVGNDGLIMELKSTSDALGSTLLNAINNINVTGITELTDIVLAMNESLHTEINNLNLTGDLTNIILAMNQSLHNEITTVQNQIDVLNSSLSIKLDDIANNISLINIVVGDIYTNTLTILTQLGIIQAQLNTTIELQNQTLNIVTETQTDVDELVNRSRRMRAWITQ